MSQKYAVNYLLICSDHTKHLTLSGKQSQILSNNESIEIPYEIFSFETREILQIGRKSSSLGIQEKASKRGSLKVKSRDDLVITENCYGERGFLTVPEVDQCLKYSLHTVIDASIRDKYENFQSRPGDEMVLSWFGIKMENIDIGLVL